MMVATWVPTFALMGGAIGLFLVVLGFVGSLVLPEPVPRLRGPRPDAAPTLPASPGVPIVPSQAPAKAEPGGVVGLLRKAMSRSREALQGRFDDLFGRPVDDSLFEELEETLLIADVGVKTAEALTDEVRQAAKGQETPDPHELRGALQRAMVRLLTQVDAPFAPTPKELLVVLVVGVNGSGKTTTIGKLASRFAAEGKQVMLAAGDTYRAAASQQLQVWAERTGARFVQGAEASDPGAVVYQALEQAKAAEVDVVLIDTAGRLQTRKPLMEQLSKLRRVIQKHVEDGPHETLLVLDGTMGQNGLSQAQLFHEATPLTGVVVTKLDGTAKGGMVLTIAAELSLPVKFIGIGEGLDDLRVFAPEAFVEALTT